MRRTIVLWEAWMTRFEAALVAHRLGRLSSDEADEAPSMSGRQFRRWRLQYAPEGSAGLADRRVGRISGRLMK